MRTYIKKLQNKNEYTRRRIFIGSLIICMSLVFVVWVSGFGYKSEKEKVAKTEEGVKPFALLGQSISKTYNGVTASVGNISSLKKGEKEKGKQINLIPVEYQ